MKQTITVYQFRDAFSGSQYEDNFSYDGLTALYNYIVEIEEDCGQEIEFDMVAIACEYSEYSVDDLRSNYDHLDDMQELTDNDELMEKLRDYTQVIPVNDDTYIIQDF